MSLSELQLDIESLIFPHSVEGIRFKLVLCCCQHEAGQAMPRSKQPAPVPAPTSLLSLLSALSRASPPSSMLGHSRAGDGLQMLLSASISVYTAAAEGHPHQHALLCSLLGSTWAQDFKSFTIWYRSPVFQYFNG